MEDMGDWGMPGNSFIRWAGEKAAWAAEWSNWDPGDTEEAEAGSVEPETRESGHIVRVERERVVIHTYNESGKRESGHES